MDHKAPISKEIIEIIGMREQTATNNATYAAIEGRYVHLFVFILLIMQWCNSIELRLNSGEFYFLSK